MEKRDGNLIERRQDYSTDMYMQPSTAYQQRLDTPPFKSQDRLASAEARLETSVTAHAAAECAAEELQQQLAAAKNEAAEILAAAKAEAANTLAAADAAAAERVTKTERRAAAAEEAAKLADERLAGARERAQLAEVRYMELWQEG